MNDQEKLENKDSMIENQNSENVTKSEKTKKSKKEKKSDKKFSIQNMRLNIGESYDKLQSNVPVLLITCLSAFVVMLGVFLAVFFINVQGPEQVLVPNVVGKTIENALIEMQVKELYPEITLRYSDIPGDEGTILEQTPASGAIVKGYSKVSLVVSRGVVVDKVGDYVGKNIDEVKMQLQDTFAGKKALITLDTPEYIPDVSPAGTILEQDPPAGASISTLVKVKLVVSRGPNYENTRRPYVIGYSINDMLQTISHSKVVYDITSHIASSDEKEGTVVSQQHIEDEFIPNYSRVTVEMAMPKAKVGDNICGIFQTKLADYPYPISMRLDAIDPDQNTYTIVSFVHPGGNLTIPYSVMPNTTLVLYVADKVVERKVIE